MRTYLECLPCFARQTLEGARLATTDEKLQEEILRRVFAKLATLDFSQTPPWLAREVYGIINEVSGNNDPYHEAKQDFNRRAEALLPEARKRIRQSSRPFETAVRLALAGNVIDFGVAGLDQKLDLLAILEEALVQPLRINDLDRLEAIARTARTILYLGDNAGEILFDRLLIEEVLDPTRVTFVVKAEPIINDATREDAVAAGLTKLVQVIDNGLRVSGTVLSETSPEFQERFQRADLVISKGQGNFETLCDEPKKNLFFLLRAKCSVVAKHLGCPGGSWVVKEGGTL